MIIKMVTESKLTVVNFCMPKPDADLYMPLDLPPNQKNLENQDRPAGLLRAMGYGPPDRGPALAKPNLIITVMTCLLYTSPSPRDA